jgi:thiosulfate/3-mercaptopyruvate sulfurtransferase
MRNPLLHACVATVALAAALSAQAPRDLPMLVDAEWLADHLDVPELLVVHVDEAHHEYAEGHLPGAAFLPLRRIVHSGPNGTAELPPPLELLLALREVGVHDATFIVFYGEPLATARAWMTLDYLGIADRAAILDGGVAEWIEAGHPLSTEPPAARSGTFTLWPETERLVDAEWIHENLGDSRVVLIDARSADEYEGRETAANARSGRIPGARHLDWTDVMDPGGSGRLRPEEDLRALFEDGGAEAEKLLVVYCSTGERSSMLYFAARMLGYQTRFYDGSWSDWSARGLPVESGPVASGAR